MKVIILILKIYQLIYIHHIKNIIFEKADNNEKNTRHKNAIILDMFETHFV